MSDRPFSFLPLNARQAKPRRRGLTEIRGPYYTPMGKRYLEDLFETMGEYVDSLKFAGGSFALMPGDALRELIDLAHRHDVAVSTGGFIERVLAYDADLVPRYIAACREVGFDTIEISSGFVALPVDAWLRLIEEVKNAGLKPRPEVGIRFGAGGGTPVPETAAEDARDPELAIAQARRFLAAGADMIMIESEGITESVTLWRTEVATGMADALGLEHVMFEAADPEVFSWYITRYGPEVNLFIDHSQIVQLEALRAGIWGTNDLWGRVVTYGEQR